MEFEKCMVTIFPETDNCLTSGWLTPDGKYLDMTDQSGKFAFTMIKETPYEEADKYPEALPFMRKRAQRGDGPYNCYTSDMERAMEHHIAIQACLDPKDRTKRKKRIELLKKADELGWLEVNTGLNNWGNGPSLELRIKSQMPNDKQWRAIQKCFKDLSYYSDNPPEIMIDHFVLGEDGYYSATKSVSSHNINDAKEKVMEWDIK